MWRADRHDDRNDETETSVAASGAPSAPRAPHASPHGLTVGDPSLAIGNAAEPTWQTWRDELSRVGGTSTLLHFGDDPRTRIELSTTHPGGLAQFITGKTTLLNALAATIPSAPQPTSRIRVGRLPSLRSSPGAKRASASPTTSMYPESI